MPEQKSHGAHSGLPTYAFLLYRMMIGVQGLTCQYSVHPRLWADTILTGEPCSDRTCNQNFPFSTLTIPPIKSQKPCMAQTLGRDVVMFFSGSFTTCRPTYDDRRHLLPTWRPIQKHFSVMKPLMVLISNNNACVLKLYLLIEHGSHGRIVRSYQTSLRAGN